MSFSTQKRRRKETKLAKSSNLYQIQMKFQLEKKSDIQLPAYTPSKLQTTIGHHRTPISNPNSKPSKCLLKSEPKYLSPSWTHNHSSRKSIKGNFQILPNTTIGIQRIRRKLVQ